jgi:hypothetical protein
VRPASFLFDGPQFNCGDVKRLGLAVPQALHLKMISALFSPRSLPVQMAMRIVTDRYAKPTPPVQVRLLRVLQFRARHFERLRGNADERNLSA